MTLERDKGTQQAVVCRVEPQPPSGIKYMLGGETWLPEVERSPVRMLCEEWGNLGPMELRPDIGPNAAGLRVRTTEIPAPAGCFGFTAIDGVYYWTAADMYGRSAEERNHDH
jgi:hypothetical protein